MTEQNQQQQEESYDLDAPQERARNPWAGRILGREAFYLGANPGDKAETMKRDGEARCFIIRRPQRANLYGGVQFWLQVGLRADLSVIGAPFYSAARLNQGWTYIQKKGKNAGKSVLGIQYGPKDALPAGRPGGLPPRPDRPAEVPGRHPILARQGGPARADEARLQEAVRPGDARGPVRVRRGRRPCAPGHDQAGGRHRPGHHQAQVHHRPEALDLGDERALVGAAAGQGPGPQLRPGPGAPGRRHRRGKQEGQEGAAHQGRVAGGAQAVGQDRTRSSPTAPPTRSTSAPPWCWTRHRSSRSSPSRPCPMGTSTGSKSTRR